MKSDSKIERLLGEGGFLEAVPIFGPPRGEPKKVGSGQVALRCAEGFPGSVKGSRK